MNLLELDMAPLDDEGDVRPVFSNIFVVWERSSTVMVSSGVAGRARGQMYDCCGININTFIRHSAFKGIGIEGPGVCIDLINSIGQTFGLCYLYFNNGNVNIIVD